MRLWLIPVVVAALAGCDSGSNDQTFYAPSDPDMSAAEPAVPVSEPNNVPPPARPAHHYDSKDGVRYSYVAAISEDDRKAGKAAGSVYTFAYLGKRGEKHVMVRAAADGRAMGEVYCSNPCRVISYPDGEQIEYNEGSIIGAAFADALAGRLELAAYDPSGRYVGPPRAVIEPATQKSADTLTAMEVRLFFKWADADATCREAVDPEVVERACGERDQIHAPALREAGLCYGKRGQAEADKGLHRCVEGSLPM